MILSFLSTKISHKIGKVNVSMSEFAIFLTNEFNWTVHLCVILTQASRGQLCKVHMKKYFHEKNIVNLQTFCSMNLLKVQKYIFCSMKTRFWL